jgi:gluconokinase
MYSGAAVVMGVASCGKTSVGQALSEKLGAVFIEGDRLHPKSNIEKMSSGVALTDEDRWPWLALVGRSVSGRSGMIVSCSALKSSYRKHIADAAGRPIFFVFLDGSRSLLEQRIAARRNHFMPSSLLSSQLATLEPPAPEEGAMRFDISLPVPTIVEQAAQWLLQQDQTSEKKLR